MSKPNEDRDVYYIPPNFLTSGRLFGGMIRARNAIEACVLVLLTGVPIIKLPFSLTTRIIILCLVSLPLGIFGVIGFEGDSLSEFAVNWVRWLIHRRTLYRSDTPVPEAPEKPMKAVSGMSAPKPPEQLGIKIKENPKKRKKRKPVKKLHKASKHKSSVAKKKQPLHAEDFIPVKDIRNGIIETTDDRYLRVIEVEPINFLLRNISEQKNIVASFASWMKISPVKVQIKVLTKKADIGKHLNTIEREMEAEDNPKCRDLQLDYYHLIQTIGSREAITRRFLVIFEYEAVTNRKPEYNEIDLELPGKQKCAYFCIVSDQDSTFDFLSSLFFSFLFIRLIRYADGYCEGGMLSTKVKFVLDEFPNCCLIPDFTKKCSTIRSRGCSVAVFFQNVGQMRNRYPDDQWQEILGACDSTVFLGCTDMLTAEYFSDRIGTASVEVEGTMRELNTMHITNYTPRFRKTNSLGRRQLLTPDEVLRLPPDQVLIFIRGQKVMRAKRYDYSLHPDYKKLKSRKAILHEPDWKTSQASSVSATGPSPSSSMATPVEKGSGNRQKKPPAKPARNTEREVVNADDIF